MKGLKYTHFLLLSILVIFFSCKKTKSLKKDDTPPPRPAETTNYIPVKFETGNYSLVLKYKDKTSLLSEITDQRGNKTVITYTEEQLPFKLEQYKNDKLFYIVYYEQPDKKVTSKVKIFDFNAATGGFTPLSSYTLMHNEQQKINKLEYYNTRNKLTDTYTFLYSASGNLQEMNAMPHPGPATITTYTFDQGKGISRYIQHNELLVFESDEWFFLCSGNNILSILNQKTPQENISFKYKYNENGYPSTAIITTNGNTETIKITYKQLEI